MSGSAPAQAAISGGQVVYLDPARDRGAYTLPPGSPGAAMLSGLRTPAPPPAPTAPVIPLPLPPGRPGRLVRLPDGRVMVTPSTLERPRAQLQVTPPAINTDPPPGVPVIQVQTNGELCVTPLAAFPGYGGADDAGPINAALLQALNGGRSAPVHLAPGATTSAFNLLSPVAMQQGSILAGGTPAAPAGGGTGANADIYGVSLVVAPGFAGGGLPQVAGLYLSAGETAFLKRMAVRDLWVDTRNAPAGIHGVSIYGQAQHVLLSRVSVWGNSADTTSDTLHIDQNTNNNFPDGVKVDNCFFQGWGRYGGYLFGSDMKFLGTHWQAAPASTTDSGCVTVLKGACGFTGCRFDQGFVGCIFDGPPGGVALSNTNLLVHCTWENIGGPAIQMLNSSLSGQALRNPVKVIGGGMYFCGRNGASPVVSVAGWNICELLGVDISCGGAGGGAYPVAGLATAAAGTGPGVPALVNVDGGFWNINGAAGAMLNDAAPATLMRYRFYGVAGGPLTNTSVPALFKSPAWP